MSRIYLDIDGVITARRGSVPNLEELHFDSFDAVLEWRPADVIRLMESFDEVVWATTWIFEPTHLDEVERVLGVKHERVDLKLPEYVRGRATANSGKRAAVRRHLEANPQKKAGRTPLVWADDELGLGDFNWCIESKVAPVRPLYDEGGVYVMLERLIEGP